MSPQERGAHTPGPWKQSPDYAREINVYGCGFRIAVMAGGELNRDIANARLMAAAPALLESADRQSANIAFILERCKLDDLPKAWREKFERELTEDRAAIAKATGTQP